MALNYDAALTLEVGHEAEVEKVPAERAATTGQRSMASVYSLARLSLANNLPL